MYLLFRITTKGLNTASCYMHTEQDRDLRKKSRVLVMCSFGPEPLILLMQHWKLVQRSSLIV